jgi:glycosyltransferase involved in cell wall biosynthesis
VSAPFTRRVGGPKRGASRILLVVHALPPFEQSGSPLLAHELACALADLGTEVGVLYPQPSDVPHQPDQAPVSTDEPFTRFQTGLTRDTWFQWATFDSLRQDDERQRELARVTEVLQTFRPEAVIVIDPVNQPTELVDVVHGLGIPILRYVLLAEDLCGMVDPVHGLPAMSVCETPFTPEQCAQCCLRSGLLRSPQLATLPPSSAPASLEEIEVGLLHKRAIQRRYYEQVYGRVLFPFESWRHCFCATMPVQDEKVRIVEPGMPGARMTDAARAARRHDRPVLSVLDRTDLRKGAALLQAAFLSPSLKDRSDYVLEIWGNDPVQISELLRLNHNAHYRGPYQMETVSDVLGESDCGIVTTYFETFHRVTRHFLLAGVPVIGSRAYGIPEIIRHEYNGLLFDVGDLDSFTRSVVRFLDDPDLRQQLQGGAGDTPVRSWSDAATQIRDVVAELLDENRGPGLPAEKRGPGRLISLLPRRRKRGHKI